MKITHTEHGTEILEVACVEGCTEVHRIDELHPEYAKIKAQLLAGDRSGILCYHELLATRRTAAPRKCN
jgi:hypothetical protein